MREKENLLNSLSLNVINNWIKNETDVHKKEMFRCYKSEKIKSTNPKMGEVIKVIKEGLFTFEGFKKFSTNVTQLIELNSIKLERSYAEFDSRYRQLVCNAIIITQDESGNYLYGFLERNRNYTEKSLIDTIGMVGGHLNNLDGSLYSGLIREVSEELRGISFETSEIYPIGYIREVSDTVSDYHLCILYSISIPYSDLSKVKSKENQEKLIWMSKDQLLAELQRAPDESRFDSWCYIAVKNELGLLE